MQQFISPEFLLVLRAVIPSFAITFIGYMLGRWDKSIHQKTVSNLIFYVFSPALIYSSLHKRLFDPRELFIIGGAVFLLIAAMLPITWFFKRRAQVTEKGYYLPIIFMSTGTLSLPISLLLYGNEGLAKAVMFHMVNILFLYSFGVFLVSGRTDYLQILKIPALWATVIGIVSAKISFGDGGGWFALSFGVVERGIDIVGYGAIPLLILSLGYSLSQSDLSDLKAGVTGGILRIIGGPLCAFLLVYLYRTTGVIPAVGAADVLAHLDCRTTEAVIVLNSAMPGPIMSYMLNVKYDNCPKKAAAMLTVGTFGGMLTIPAVLQLINKFIF
jgi:predicted permease